MNRIPAAPPNRTATAFVVVLSLGACYPNSPNQPRIMSYIRKISQGLGCWAMAATAALAANSPEASSKFFRSDTGKNFGLKTGPLPDRLDAPGALRWRLPVDSGHSTPVLCGGKIILTTYRDAEKELATVALDQETGRLLWKQVVPTARIEPVHRTGNPAASTPAFDGERLYVFFGSHGLVCYDLDGKKLWHHPLGPFQDEFGSSSSPVLVDDKVILQEDHDLNSFLMAIDRSTGQMVWKTPRPDAVRSYSTPTVWTANGRKQLLVAGALELAGYDPSNGEKLWWVNGLARIVIPIPVAAQDMIYMASWSPGGDSGARIALESWASALGRFDKNKDGKLAKAEVEDAQVLDRFFRMDLDQSGDLIQKEWDRHAEVFRRAQNAVLALKPSGRGDLTEKALLWKHPRGAPYVATPLLDNGILWMVKDLGIVTKLDAVSGRVLSEERVPGIGSYYASPVTGDGKVYFASELGVASIVANQPGWRVISSHDFKEKIYATPVIDRDRIYIRTEKALYCFQGKAAGN
ncbi:MAG: PQQ-binding-like beta-propeller repeat protein [Verrucomicrobia bacterium]|nr:PQQ-binding-like beta-propeller repeat protein [Verrucomicrobiota bacterium]